MQRHIPASLVLALALSSLLLHLPGSLSQPNNIVDYDKYLNNPYYFPIVPCPPHPNALCDFYFDGYENIVPTFYLGDGVLGDHALVPLRREDINVIGDMSRWSPAVKDKKTGNSVLANTRNGTFLKYPDGTYNEMLAEATFDQFYLNAKTDAVSHLYARSWKPDNPEWGIVGINEWSKKCVFLPFSAAWIQSTQINLNQGDNNTDYQIQRRCVVFKTEL